MIPIFAEVAPCLERAFDNAVEGEHVTQNIALIVTTGSKLQVNGLLDLNGGTLGGSVQIGEAGKEETLTTPTVPAILGKMRWTGGTIGFPGVGTSSADIQLTQGNMTIAPGTPKTLAGALTLKK